MNFENVRTQFTDLLNEHFTVQQIKVYQVDPSALKPIELTSVPMVGIEFIINHSMHLHIFGVVRDGEIKFTRPKEGIRKFILQEVRNHDFVFRMNDKINTRFNLFARIIDTWLTYEASEYIKKTVSFWRSESKNNLEYCLGYKVLYPHRFTKTFDAQFEVHINKGGTYHIYEGMVINGALSEIRDENLQVVSPEKLFEV
jgi:hypothetical protein